MPDAITRAAGETMGLGDAITLARQKWGDDGYASWDMVRGYRVGYIERPSQRFVVKGQSGVLGFAVACIRAGLLPDEGKP